MWPEHIKQRYGVNKSSKLPLFLAIILAIIVASGLGMANYRQSHPSLDWTLRTFDVKSENRVFVEWQMLRQENKDTYCVLRAQDERRTDVGYVTVLTPAGSKDVTTSYEMNTESLAVLVEILGCSYQEQMRVPPANFPPGVKIPSQDPPGFAPAAG